VVGCTPVVGAGGDAGAVVVGVWVVVVGMSDDLGLAASVTGSPELLHAATTVAVSRTGNAGRMRSVENLGMRVPSAVCVVAPTDAWRGGSEDTDPFSARDVNPAEELGVGQDDVGDEHPVRRDSGQGRGEG